MRSTMQEVQLTVGRLLCHGTTAHARATAATWQGDRFENLTYGELGHRTSQLAGLLRRLGVRTAIRLDDPQSVVATMMWNTHRHLELFWAVPAMGAVLHPLNPRMNVTQLVHAIDQAGDEVLVVDEDLLGLLTRVLPRTAGSVRHVVVARASSDVPAWSPPEGCAVAVHDYEELLAACPTEYLWNQDLDERAAAVMCFTSGTTSAPKGVVYSHRSIYLHALQMASADRYHLSARERLLPLAPMFHVNGWGIPHAALLSGAGLLLPGRHTQAPLIARMIEEGRPTLAAGVPTVWISLLEELDRRPYDVSSLQRGVVGGAACPPSLLAAYRDRHSLRLLHAWGMTETSSLATLAVDPVPAEGEGALGEEQAWGYRTTQGQFPASIRYRLIGQDGAPVPCDGASTGELEITGPGVTGAYYGGREGPPATPSDSFRDDGWFRTGDVGSITPDGYLRLSDRTKDVIKSGGEYISSVELENALMAHSEVREAAVIAFPDARWGERPLSVVALRGNRETPFDELRDWVEERVESWQVPEYWAVLEEIPKTPIGKFDKRELRTLLDQNLLRVTTLKRRPELVHRALPIDM
ncbi:long-chain-fatty-acid--CoA ligase [Streptomyces sp. NPDC057798]|uniref:long-chain-fatty-acid--CoA ligase n=1 Tax=Streptomyces sp. NPDC057798 TaxID=3346252 RepID=UPI0036D03335